MATTHAARMREIRKAANAREAEALIALAQSYYAADTTPTETGVARDNVRVHRAHDTSAYPRIRAAALSGDWSDIDAGRSKVDHVKVTRDGVSAHVDMSGFRKARADKKRAARAATVASLAQERKVALLASVQTIGNID